MQIHNEEHPLAGTTVVIKKGEFIGQSYRIEDYWDRVYGKGWGYSDGNPAALMYAMRLGSDKNVNLPWDDEVVYGKIGGLGHLVHVKEFE